MATVYMRDPDNTNNPVNSANPLPVVLYDAQGNLLTPQYDQTDRQAVSIYGKATAAGDTPVLVDANGRTPIVGGAILAVTAVTAQPAGVYVEGATTARLLGIAPFLFNGGGSVNEIMRNNHELTVFASAARTASHDSADLINYNARYAVFVIDVTAADVPASHTFTIQGKSSLGTDYYTILASVAITATGVTVLRVGPALTAAANTVANDVLPRVFRVSVVAGTADSITYSMSVNLVV